MDEFITACPRNCYSTCTFKVRVKDNRITGILPFSENLACPEGPCIKGLSYLERAHSPERIVYPLVKAKNGKFQRTTISNAIGIISEKLESARQKYGPHSIFWYKGSGMSGLTNEIGNSFWEAFGGVTTTYGNLCWPAGLEAVRLTLGSVKHNVPWDIVNAKTIILWGKNPAETNIQEIAFIEKARNKGCKVIVIDPIRTPTADKADMLFSINPGTDAALALAIARVLIENDLIDKEFIHKYILGFDEFRKSLKISLKDAEEITGIPSENIIQLAHIIGNGAPLTIIPGYGLQRHLNGGQTVRSILALSAITGNLGKPGTGFNYANLQSYIYDDLKEPLSYYPNKNLDSPFRRIISMAMLGSDLLQVKDPVIKVAWIERGNPVLQSPDSIAVIKAFESIDYKVVIEQFMTDTAKMADIILPAKNMFEQSDIIGSYWSPYIQLKPKVLDPPIEVLPESEIYYNLSELLKLDIDEDKLPEPGNENIENWLRLRIKGYSEIRLEDLRKAPLLAPGLQKIAWEDMMFGTPSGKIELLSDEAKNIWGVSSLPDYTECFSNKDTDLYPLTFLTPNTASRIHSQFGNLKIINDTINGTLVHISYQDAKKRNIVTGSKLRLFNRKGEFFSTARVSNRIPSGIIVLPNGIWLSEGGGGNILIEGRETDMGFGAAFHDYRIEVELAD